jgi:hypothetical protein
MGEVALEMVRCQREGGGGVGQGVELNVMYQAEYNRISFFTHADISDGMARVTLKIMKEIKK